MMDLKTANQNFKVSGVGGQEEWEMFTVTG